MAVTKFLSRKTRLDMIIKYIMNGEKTEKMMYVSGVNCRPDTAISEMQDTKKRFDKEDGIISYHLIQSFDGKEISPKKCHELGLQYAKELFGDNYTKEKIRYRIENKIYNQVYIPKKKYKMSIEEYNKFKQKQREHQLRELPALYIVICILLRIDPLPEKIEIKDYKIPITKEMKISIKHLESLSQQTILLSENKISNLEELKSYRYNLEEDLRILKGKRENLWRKRSKETNPEIKEKITHEIGNLRDLIKKTNKDIVNCYEIENRTILLQHQLEFEKSKKTVKEKRVDKRKLRDR